MPPPTTRAQRRQLQRENAKLPSALMELPRKRMTPPRPATISALVRRLFGRPQQPAVPQEAAAQAPLPAVAHRAGWFALPGGRLEYLDTGMAITLATDARLPAYTLHTPEGLAISASAPGFLAPLQAYAEQVAAERAAFVPTSHRQLP